MQYRIRGQEKRVERLKHDVVGTALFITVRVHDKGSRNEG